MRRRLLELNAHFSIGHSIDVLPGIEAITLVGVEGQWSIQSTEKYNTPTHNTAMVLGTTTYQSKRLYEFEWSVSMEVCPTSLFLIQPPISLV